MALPRSAALAMLRHQRAWSAAAFSVPAPVSIEGPDRADFGAKSSRRPGARSLVAMSRCAYVCARPRTQVRVSAFILPPHQCAGVSSSALSCAFLPSLASIVSFQLQSLPPLSLSSPSLPGNLPASPAQRNRRVRTSYLLEGRLPQNSTPLHPLSYSEAPNAIS